MYAVIRTGGKQYRVAPGQTIRVEKLDGEVGAEVRFDDVLLYSDGEALSIGRPQVENTAVVGRIVEQDKAKKVLVFKYKRRKGFRRKRGHRQPYTAVYVDRIEA
ncbi:MAG: 50S ribosomal protein L21 [Deltaproteobacteria bacterium]|nr:50S ribosomal protein L21 [Deltaproteobacteria bacterium]